MFLCYVMIQSPEWPTIYFTSRAAMGKRRARERGGKQTNDASIEIVRFYFLRKSSTFFMAIIAIKNISSICNFGSPLVAATNQGRIQDSGAALVVLWSAHTPSNLKLKSTNKLYTLLTCRKSGKSDWIQPKWKQDSFEFASFTKWVGNASAQREPRYVRLGRH